MVDIMRVTRATNLVNRTGAPTAAPPWQELYADRAGTPLEIWLRDNGALCRDMRLLYVIQANMDRTSGVLKFGRAGGGTDGRADSRLWGYVHMYGRTGGDPAQGVRLLYLGGTGKTPGVPWARSRVYKAEARLRQWAEDGGHLGGRGAERVVGVAVRTLFLRIRTSARAALDEIAAQRRALRLVRPSDRVVAVTGHYRRGGRQLTRYLLQWSADGPYTLETLRACSRFPAPVRRSALAAIRSYKASRPRVRMWHD